MTLTMTLLANFVRNIPSSMAASPEPMTMTVFPVFAAASQVAQKEMPLSYKNLSSPGAPVSLGLPPLAMMTERHS